MTDITIRFPSLAGVRYGAPDQRVLIENAGGPNARKTMLFLDANRRHMEQVLCGGSYHAIQQSRVDGFIAWAAKHGLKAEWRVGA